MNKDEFYNSINEFSDDAVESYLLLEKTHNKLSRNKVIIVIFAGAVIALFEVIRYKNWGENIHNFIVNFFLWGQTLFNYHIFQLLIALLLCIISSYLIHLHSYNKSKLNASSSNNVNILSFFNEIFRKYKLISLLFFLLPDFFIAKAFKDTNKNKLKRVESNSKCDCKDECPVSRLEKISMCDYDRLKITNKFFIEFSNWFNLCFTTILVALTVLFWGVLNEVCIQILTYFVSFRIASRATEIVIAFYNDVVKVNAITFIYKTDKGESSVYISNWKNSLLLKTGRISLAVHTLLEIVFIFSILYLLVSKHVIFDGLPIHNDGHYIEFLLFSASVSVFNFSFFDYKNVCLSIMHVSQVFLSMVLIVLSVARYLGLSDELTAREEEFFHKIELKRQINQE
ncbi:MULTISPECIES: hypothetical protein [unclassified Paenibacillus]|uniref:hypothetical protein n=1 Tax=unclassified Paenibacillus TaxID=185978 RepID=UPI002407460B|nr:MULTISPECIES: hypothetical protein [unclassified Paenibacillus]MDF9841758.1 hypothetical protein [Paenibacillus sp. PastF-2]MDF9848561.1 hypothetical protein [Paenibacillus sp. PastM-2]MDF9854917.1 hypothetical protein [Paenibacillus sp. PastF-1]MDH6480187.1 hypothetical protein [Paenibacillus sp. PastH-2]MDH6507829.1 hypothetical protein [Paenibacillus sp. PastM-3]